MEWPGTDTLSAGQLILLIASTKDALGLLSNA